MKRLILAKGHDRRIRGGHPWIFSNEIKQLEGDPQTGDALEVFSAGGEFQGVAYFNPHSLIAARLLTRQPESIDTPEFFRRKIENACAYRKVLYPDSQALRVVFGESDGLPGLVVDRYSDVLAVQFLTAGIDMRRAAVVEALSEVLQPKAIVARNDLSVRRLEGLEQQIEVLHGPTPEPLTILEHGLRFKVDIMGGQKTGHFLDQKENHLALQGRVEGRRVLDLFCYSGGWSAHAARFGAREVLGVDISPGAITLAEENCRLNFQEAVCRFQQADVFELLRDLQGANEPFETIILDPPAFVKSKKKLPEALRGYLTINRRALEITASGGFLFSCSCSYHMQRDIFLEMLREAARQSGRDVRLLEMRGQAWDHPVLLSCPETDYLKCAVLQVL